MSFSLEEPKRILDDLRTSLANMESWWMSAQKINPDFSSLFHYSVTKLQIQASILKIGMN